MLAAETEGAMAAAATEHDYLSAAASILPKEIMEAAEDMENSWNSEPKPSRLKLVYGCVMASIIEAMMGINEEMDGLLAWCDIISRPDGIGLMYEFKDPDDYEAFDRFSKKYDEKLSNVSSELSFFRRSCINYALHEQYSKNTTTGQKL